MGHGNRHCQPAARLPHPSTGSHFARPGPFSAIRTLVCRGCRDAGHRPERDEHRQRCGRWPALAAHREINANPRVALLFYWAELSRQVRITGTACHTSAAENLRYFLSRPRDSQIGAWVSAQSSVISSRSLIESKFMEMRQKFAAGEVPLPSFWGGYRVNPDTIEFWQAGEHRLHDRFLYSRSGSDWSIARLAP
jgi:hypothetical protein